MCDVYMYVCVRVRMYETSLLIKKAKHLLSLQITITATAVSCTTTSIITPCVVVVVTLVVVSIVYCQSAAECRKALLGVIVLARSARGVR